jgi:hypothetical protein
VKLHSPLPHLFSLFRLTDRTQEILASRSISRAIVSRQNSVMDCLPRTASIALRVPATSVTTIRFSANSLALRLRRRVLHQCSHLRTKTWGRIQLDRCRLVIRLQKVKKFPPNFDVYVERLDRPGAKHQCPTDAARPRRRGDRIAASNCCICSRQLMALLGRRERCDSARAPNATLLIATVFQVAAFATRRPC